MPRRRTRTSTGQRTISPNSATPTPNDHYTENPGRHETGDSAATAQRPYYPLRCESRRSLAWNEQLIGRPPPRPWERRDVNAPSGRDWPARPSLFINTHLAACTQLIAGQLVRRQGHPDTCARFSLGKSCGGGGAGTARCRRPATPWDAWPGTKEISAVEKIVEDTRIPF